MMEGSEGGSGSVLVNNRSGCGSRRPKDIRIRIRNTRFNPSKLWGTQQGHQQGPDLNVTSQMSPPTGIVIPFK
jgi:hypothetical protein